MTPVVEIDGARIGDFNDFVREFSRHLDGHTWNGNLDAFNDILRGGFGTPEHGFVFRWVNADQSRAALGYDATVRRLEQTRATCHHSHRGHVEQRLRAARRGTGPTLFDEIVQIIRGQDGVVLELA